MSKSRRILFYLVVPVVILLVSMMIFIAGTDEEVEEKGPINILWAEFDMANFLQELCNIYTDETGVVINVEQTPWGDFQTKAFAEFAAHGDAYDIVVGDSQWLGRGATQGHYVELTDFMKENGIDKSMLAATITAYSEYPKGSGRYWAVPLMGDAVGWAYRKDKFEDPKEMAAFKAKYGYALDVPETWAQLRDIAEFFYRPSENFYGLGMYTQKDYDALTMGVLSFLWAYGSDLGDYDTYKVKGILNNQGGIKAIELYRELYGFTPPEWSNVFFLKINQAISEGQIAMAMGYWVLFPSIVNPAMSKHADDIGFFACPRGPAGRYSAIGGQGASLISYSKKQKLALDWLEWFGKSENQIKWAELGGYTCNEKALQSETFINATPYNRYFIETLPMVKDFWAVPEYADLLEVSQRYWHQYVVAGEGTAKQAMDGIAEEWEVIFQKYGYYD